MRVSRLQKFVVAVGLALLGAVALPAHDAPAQQVGATPTAALRTAAVWFGPLPMPSLFSPSAMQRIEQLAADNRWPMPEIKPWPLDAQGKPIVDTRQADELWYTVEPHHESLHAIIQKFRGRASRYHELNPNVDFSNLHAGEKILVWERDTDHVSQSIGNPDHGRLRYGEPMPPGDDYVILYPHRSFGTYYTVSEIVRAMDAFKVRFPEAYPVMIGDLSFRTGRRIHPHKSHTAGRDVDITYPTKHPQVDYRWFHRIRRRDINIKQTLWLLKSFIDGGQVEYIFCDRNIQRLLVREAKREGAPAAWIAKVFQYPRYSGTRAIVRHAHGHRDHFHIRFKCQETDQRCRT